jgi:hypothetical protein
MLIGQVLLIDRPTLAPNVGDGQQNMSNPLSGEPFSDAGLQLDPLGFGDVSEYMMDDLWFLDVPSLDNIPPLD